MNYRRQLCTLITLLLVLLIHRVAHAQSQSGPEQIPVTTQWLLSSAKPAQRTRLNAVTENVFLMRCLSRKGTGFLIKNGLVVTNEHVVENCAAADISARSAHGKTINFS